MFISHQRAAEPKKAAESTSGRGAFPASRAPALSSRAGTGQPPRRPARPAAAGRQGGGQAPAIVHEVLRTPGAPLDPGTRNLMEERLGADFSHVRVHTDGRAAASARAVGALAYTAGRSIVFGPGRYAPDRGDGRGLLAHELVHTIQQGAAGPPVNRQRLSVEPAASPAEHEARTIAAAARAASMQPSAPAGRPAAASLPLRYGRAQPGFGGRPGYGGQLTQPPRSPIAIAPRRSDHRGIPAHQLQRAFVQLPPSTSEQPAVGEKVTPEEAWRHIKQAGLEEKLTEIIDGKVGKPKVRPPENQPEVRPPENRIEYVLRKLAEGPDIRFTSADDLLREIKERLVSATAPQLGDPALKVWRKLNRLAGQLEASLVTIKRQPGASQSQMTTMVTSLEAVLKKLRSRKSNTDDDGLLACCTEALRGMKALIGTDPRSMWFLFQAVSSFGPLGHTLVDAAPEDVKDGLKKQHDDNLTLLREIRHLMARREELTVIAHRGSGPTNRTMGRLIHQQDQRRLNRPAENSPEAFGAALAETTRPPEQTVAQQSETYVPRLDGVECDVFLSADGVPILSHEGNVAEQLTTTQRQQENLSETEQHVHQLKKDRLLTIKRTPSPGSGFMTLADLLAMVKEPARLFYEATGHPLRVEIEMKGTKHDKDFTTGSDSPLTAAVAKVVSKAIKANREVPVEYIMFNGTPAEIPVFAALRQSKTALGGLYTGLGPPKDQKEFDLAHIDELRYQFTALLPPPEELRAQLRGQKVSLANIVDPYMDKFILTLVYGEEMAPTGHPEYNELALSGPSHRLVPNPSRRAPNPDPTARKIRAEDRSGIEDLIQQLLKEYIAGGGKAEWLHILTDYPKKAEFMKKRLAEA